ALDNLLHVDLVAHGFDAGADLAAEFNFADRQGAAASGRAGPAHEEADQLPHGVEAKTAGHHRIVPEMAFEKPAVRANVELSFDAALAVRATIYGDLGDAIEHQHRR